MIREKFNQTLTERVSQLICLMIGLFLAAVCGYYVAQGPGAAIVTIAAVIVSVWIFLFLSSPVNGMIVIVIIKTLTDRVNLQIFGPLTVNAMFYLAVLGGGLAFCVLNRDALKSNGAIKAYAAFVFYALATVFIAPNLAEGFAAWTREAAMFMLYVLFGVLMTNEKEQRKYVLLIGAIAVLGVGMSLAQKVGLLSHYYETRYSGTFGHPNFFAYFLLIPTSLAASFLMFSRSRRVRVACTLFLGLGLLGLMLTYTRGAWIAAAVMCLLLGLLGKKWFLVCSLTAMFAVYLVAPSVQERLHWLVSDTNLNAASAGRLAMWEAGLPLIKRNPILGNGLQSYVHYTRGDAHNSYLKLQFETGLVGLLLYSLFLLINMRYMWHVWKRATEPFERTLALGVFCFFVAFLIGGLWENLFLGQGTQWFSYSAAGMMAAAAMRLPALRNPTAPRTSMPLRGPAPAVIR